MRTLLVCLLAAAPVMAQDRDVDAVESLEGGVASEEVETVVEKTRHDVVPANTLWDLAEHYYRDPRLWPRIYEANIDRIEDPHWIYPGQVFVIPGLDRTVTVVRKPVEPEPEPQPEPLAPPVVEAPKPKRVLPKLKEELPAYSEGEVPRTVWLSERLPDKLVGGGAINRLKLVPEDWRADGVIETKFDNGLGIVGDVVEFKLLRGEAPRKGVRLSVYREGERRKDKNGTYVEKVAVLKVVSANGSRVRAAIVKSSDAVLEGDWVRRD